MKPCKAIIIGGGIGGLCTALALHKLGFEVEVHEKAAVLSPAGAGIIMAANARKVFRWLGIDNEVRDSGMALDRLDLTDRFLKPFRDAKGITAAGPDDQAIAIHRARLQDCFLRHMPGGLLFTGSGYVRHHETPEDVCVEFSDGSTRRGDLLIGADGIHSKLRQAIFQGTSIRYSGQTSWRGVTEFKLESGDNRFGFEAWGSAGRFGAVPISATETYWFAVQTSAEGGRDLQAPKPFLHQLFKGWAPMVHDILESTDPQAILRTDISDLQRLGAWHRGRVCLIGDAAHATTPNFGQGGAQAIEDAWYLSNLLALAPTHELGFARFEQARRKKVDMIVNGSWRFGRMAHSAIGRQILQLGMRLAPESALRRQFLALQEIQEQFS